MTKRYIRDTAERLLRTYAQAFLGALILSGFGVNGLVDVSVLAKAAGAAIPAVLSLAMSLLARGVGDKESASLAKPPIVA